LWQGRWLCPLKEKKTSLEGIVGLEGGKEWGERDLGGGKNLKVKAVQKIGFVPGVGGRTFVGGRGKA